MIGGYMDNRGKIREIEDYMMYLKELNEKVQHEKGRIAFNLHDNVPFLIATAGVAFIGSSLALAPVLEAYTLLASVPAGVLGFFAPKAVHGLKFKSNGKVGIKAAKNQLGRLVHCEYQYLLICMADVVTPENFNEIPADRYEEFLDKIYEFADCYKNQLDSMVGKRISERVASDYDKIVKILDNNKSSYSSALSKVADIIEKNKDFVSPWCELYNECGKDAKKLMDYACQLDGELEMPKSNNYFADEDLLAKKVDIYMKKNGMKSTNQKLDLYLDNSDSVSRINKEDVYYSRSNDNKDEFIDMK